VLLDPHAHTVSGMSFSAATTPAGEPVKVTTVSAAEVLQAGPDSEACRAAVDLLLSASADPAISSATYLPPDMAASAAVAWLESRPELSWMLVEDGKPCGWYELDSMKGSIELTLPTPALEREVWLLDTHRGRRIVQAATSAISEQLAGSGVRYIVGIAWETNRSALRGMAAAGFSLLGSTWWSCEGHEPGQCEAWILEIPRSS
jgi:hypothetical protein